MTWAESDGCASSEARTLIQAASGKSIEGNERLDEVLDDLGRYVLISTLTKRYDAPPDSLHGLWESVDDVAWFIERRRLD